MARRRRFDTGDFRQLANDRIEQALPFVHVRQFAAAEDDRDQHLVAMFEELARLLDLDLDVVLAGLRPDADLFQPRLMHDCLMLALGLLVFEFAKIHHPHDRRLFVGRDFDQVESVLARLGQGFGGRKNTELLSIAADQADAGDADLFVDALFLLDGVDPF